MWKLHIFVNNGYRNLLHGTLRGQQHVVTKRKVEKLYNNYLTVALLFYKGYFQRLQAMHGMPQIPRINSLLQLDALDIDEAQSARAPADAVRKSFHATLLHLGDISRWRDKARPRPDGLQTAMLFYELAHDLNPRSGAAHHQLGIMMEGKHLHVVYHLYRSVAVENPHPNALPNLEQEFKKLSQPTTPGRRSGPPDPDEAFSNWFTKLHARSYKGEQFSQELEDEVIHRLEIALKKPYALPVLLKMVLINIAAYHVAKYKINKEYSLNASNSCQYILRLNVRWILVLSRLLQSELLEYVKAAPPTENATSKDDSRADAKISQQVSIFTETILPLARIYMAWLFIYRADIVEYQDHLAHYVFDMYRALAQSLTMMAREFKSVLAASPYLLPEDVEALGMKPFDDAKLESSVCRIHHEYKTDNFKPHWEDTGRPRNTPEQETKSRVYDLVNCGFSLALDDRFPLGITTSASQGSSEAITISYLEGGKVPTLIQEPDSALPAVGEQLAQTQGQGLGYHDDSIPVQPSSHDGNVRGAPATVCENADHGHTRALSKPVGQHKTGVDQSHPVVNDPLETESDLSLHFRMEHMVDDLLDEDESDLGVHPQQRGLEGGPEDPSYGMHSATAEKVFGGLQIQDHGVGAVYGVSSGSPWDSFQGFSRHGARQRSSTKTPQHGALAGLHASSPTVPGTTRSSILQPSVPAFIPGAQPQSGSDERSFSPASANGFGNQFGQAGLGFGRPSSGFSGSARDGLGHARQRLGGSTDSSGASPFLSPKGDARAYRIATGPQNVDEKGKSVSPSSGFGWGKSSFSTTFSQNVSGLPSVNSPFGLPAAGFDGAFAQRDPSANYQTYSAPANNWTQYQQPSNLSLVSNGNIYNATTAYGRGDIATKDDPTHFRNAVRGTSMATAVAEADAYDRAILESALVDNQAQLKR